MLMCPGKKHTLASFARQSQYKYFSKYIWPYRVGYDEHIFRSINPGIVQLDSLENKILNLLLALLLSNQISLSMDQGSNKNHSPAYHFAPTVIKFCVMWEGSSLPHDTKFGNCRCEIVDSRAFPSWSLIHGLRWSSLIKAEPGVQWMYVYII